MASLESNPASPESPPIVSDEIIARGAQLLAAGELVAIPTETVYGLAADATNPAAVRKIFAAKGRPADHPLIVHIAYPDEIDRWGTEIPPAAWDLAAAFWPGPLTLIVRRRSNVDSVVAGGLDTIAVRCPSHPIAQWLLRELGRGVAAPSANKFGHVSPTTAAHVLAEFGDTLPLVIDGGACEVGLESTIVDLSQSTPTILRPGVISQTDLELVLGLAIGDPHANSTPCSGRLASHYAPNCIVEIVTEEELTSKLASLDASGRRVGLLATEEGSVRALAALPADRIVWLPSDAKLYARGLYGALRAADERGFDHFLVVLPPLGHPLSAAILDRLQKAAGPRDSRRV